MDFKTLIIRGIKELILTFSNKKSLLSSKRIERFVAYSSMLSLTILYVVIRLISRCEPNYTIMPATDLMLIVGVWLTYVGYNIKQGQKDNQVPPLP